MTRVTPSTTDQAVPADAAQDPAMPLDGPWQTDWSREQQMTELGIAQDGRHYFYNGYRYDRLPDALAYAELMKSRPRQVDEVGPHRQNRENPSVLPPSDADLVLMARRAITFRDGIYYFGEFRYDRLADALDYADRTTGIVEAPPR